MRARDTARSRVYDAERLVFRLFDRADEARTVQLVGTELTLPVEARFGSVDSVRGHVDRVLAMPAVRARFTRAAHPVAVRERRGDRSAHYSRTADGDAEIAIPSSRDGRWALRELVVLHELAHHLDDSGGPAHGREFVVCLIDLVGLVLGPEAALVYRVIFSDSGVGP
ncbi:TIGR04338 family metallohydrolase [Gordonia sp. NPDC003424]